MADREDVEGVGDQREKHVTVVTTANERHEHGDVYLRHATEAFLVSPDPEFPPATTDRYAKADLRRVEITQHHSACFITTATAGDGETLAALRTFRDDALASNPAGRTLVWFYETVSPPVARTLERHPRSRTARAVRWLVERCGSLSRARTATGSPLVRLALTVVLTLLYGIGMLLAVAGHLGIRAGEWYSRRE
jgi:hypothetical protein